MSGGLKRRDVLSAMAIVGMAAVPIVSRAAAVVSPDLVRRMAPSGRLRAAINIGNVVLARRGGALGANGISVDIATEMARRLGVELDLIIYDTAGKVVTQLAQDHWDVAFMGIDPGRGADISFTRPYVVIEGTYLVRADSPCHHVADLDRPATRIAVGGGTAYDLYLERALKHAQLIRFPTSPDAVRHFVDDRLEAAAGIRQALADAAQGLQGYRILPDSFNRIEQAVALPKGREGAVDFAQNLLLDLKAKGQLRASLLRSGQDESLLA